jgi:hypothetical protein
LSVGRVGKDQITDYAERRGMPLAEIERWLRPNLAYDPESMSHLRAAHPLRVWNC